MPAPVATNGYCNSAAPCRFPERSELTDTGPGTNPNNAADESSERQRQVEQLGRATRIVVAAASSAQKNHHWVEGINAFPNSSR